MRGSVKGEAGTLKKDLGLLEVFTIASGAMISSGLFILPGIAFAQAGPVIFLSYLLAGFVMLPTMLSMAELSTAMPKAGGDYFYIDRSMGPIIGTISGFASWTSLNLKIAFSLLGIGIFTSLIHPAIDGIYVKLIAVLFCLVFMFINIKGVKHAGKSQDLIVIALLTLLAIYIGIGMFFLKPGNFSPLAPEGRAAVLSTAGLVFVSYMGLTKVCSVSEEIRSPGRNIPLGMMLAWLVVTLLYVLTTIVTVGLADPSELAGSKIPISLGASAFLGRAGLMVMAAAAILAFVSTANSGILSSSRYPFAMSRDHLLPPRLSGVSKNGIPVLAVVVTASIMIIVIMFFDVARIAKFASALVLLMFCFVNLSVIMMREGRIRCYRPKFKAPLYPWIQIGAVLVNLTLIVMMGYTAVGLVVIFILLGLVWYFLYSRGKIKREYGLLHVIERVMGIKQTSYMVDEELREIIIERDHISERNFEDILRTCDIVDLYKFLSPVRFAHLLAERIAYRSGEREASVFKYILKKEADSDIMVHPGIAIVMIRLRGRRKFHMMMARSKKGFIISRDQDPIHAFIVMAATRDRKSFYLHALMWLLQISEGKDFRRKWIDANNTEELRLVVLDSWNEAGRGRHISDLSPEGRGVEFPMPP